MAEQEFVDFEIDGDFQNTKEFGGGDFPLLPISDNYIFEVSNLEQKPASTGTPMVVATFVVAEGQEDEELAKYTGQKAWGNYPLTEKALGRLKNLMMACGAPLDKFRASACLGAKIRASIIHSQGSTDPGPDGKPRVARTFANIVNEKPFDAGKQEAAPPPPPPPVTKATNSKATTTQTRRA